MTKLVKKTWMFWEEDATAYCEVMESFLIDNKMDSAKMRSVSPSEYVKLFGEYVQEKMLDVVDSWLLFGCDDEEFATKLLAAINDSAAARNWTNIVEAARHENPDIARLLKSVVIKESLVEISDDSVEKMLRELRKKRSMTFAEIKYVRMLVERATDQTVIDSQKEEGIAS